MMMMKMKICCKGSSYMSTFEVLDLTRHLPELLVRAEELEQEVVLALELGQVVEQRLELELAMGQGRGSEVVEQLALVFVFPMTE